MELLESSDLPLGELLSFHVVLGELSRCGKSGNAAELAWTAVESVVSKSDAASALRVAGPFLLAVGEAADLRKQVADLYRQVHGEQEGFDALLSEAGLVSGRPVRRALRTLDVALTVRDGDYLACRDDEGAARVDSVDRSGWQFDITNAQGPETLGVVHLADRYYPIAATAFRALRQFSPDKLLTRLEEEPAAVLLDLCMDHGGRIDGGRLESMMVPSLFSESEWKKWYSRARVALKRLPRVQVEGRPPYTITYREISDSLEDALLADFAKREEPIQVHELVEKYLRECKSRKQDPSKDALKRIHDTLCKRAQTSGRAASSGSGLNWLVAARIEESLEKGAGYAGLVQWCKEKGELGPLLAELEHEPLMKIIHAALVEAKPDTWEAEFLDPLPTFSSSMCDFASSRLVEAGRTRADFEPLIQRILSSPLPHFDALLWLWNGPSGGATIGDVPLTAALTRIFRTLEDCKRGDPIGKERAKTIVQHSKNVMSLRRYERFIQCLEGMDSSMAVALRGQLRRLESLGRSVREDLLTLIRQQFPTLDAPPPTVQPWARQDVLFVTSEGLMKKQAELDQHVNVKMKENARAIGAAAEHGDLSENSEYKFALEERDLLRARLAQMNSELTMAKVISKEDVPTDHIGIGTRVMLRRVSDGEAYEMTLVGPWEADGAKGRYNYHAPFAQEVLGKRPGEMVEFNHSGAVGTYEIVELHNALDEDASPSHEVVAS